MAMISKTYVSFKCPFHLQRGAYQHDLIKVGWLSAINLRKRLRFATVTATKCLPVPKRAASSSISFILMVRKYPRKTHLAEAPCKGRMINPRMFRSAYIHELSSLSEALSPKENYQSEYNEADVKAQCCLGLPPAIQT